jgi:gamma-glutamylcyclotransferase (GGCT)/AIG2-like uncharacterized protein YtfP
MRDRSALSDGRAYRVAGELTRARMRRSAPADAEALAAVGPDDVVVVPGVYDSVERVLEVLGVPHVLVAPDELAGRRLRPDQLVVVNCPGHLPDRALPALRDFVAAGGMLFTTDWALRHVVEPAFPGTVAYNGRPTGDEVVRIEVASADDPLVAGVLDDGGEPQWWLEASSYPVRVLEPAVSVLIASAELGARYGEAAVVVRFAHGEGVVLHMVSHYYLQRTETRTRRQAAPGWALVAEVGLADVADPAAVEDLRVGELESAMASVRLVANVVAARKRGSPAPGGSGAGPRAVFVYGTLMPGHLRHAAIERFVADRRLARVRGRLYDTGRGFPAAVFGGDGWVEGWLLTLRPGTEGRALAAMDRIEGSLYLPVTVETADGETAIAYEWRGEVSGLRPLAGRWDGD